RFYTVPMADECPAYNAFTRIDIGKADAIRFVRTLRSLIYREHSVVHIVEKNHYCIIHKRVETVSDIVPVYFQAQRLAVIDGQPQQEGHRSFADLHILKINLIIRVDPGYSLLQQTSQG